MSGWKTVEVKRNRKEKKAKEAEYTDSDEDYRVSSNTDYHISTAADFLSGAKKAVAPKREEPTRAQLAAAAATHAEEVEKRRAERKANAADAARLKRKEAQEHARRANDPTQWPTVAAALSEQSEAFMDYFDGFMEDDPIMSKGGIGALLAYAPSIFEKFTYRTQLLEEEALGTALMTQSLENQVDMFPEALDTFVYYKSLLTKMPEVKSGSGAGSHAICDGFMALLAAVWGSKGLKNALASKDTGRGATIAVELTFEQLWAQGLQHIGTIAAMFVDVAKQQAYGPVAIDNFHRIFAVMTYGAKGSEDKDVGRMAIAKAAAILCAGGFLGPLFADDKKNSTTVLLDTIAEALRYVSTKNLSAKAYSGVSWKDAGAYGEAIVKRKLGGRALGDAWSVIGIELLARQSATLANALVPSLLDALEGELGTKTSFSPAESTPVVILSTIFALYGSNCTGVLKAHAPKAPKGSFVFLAIAKTSKLFEVSPSLEETIVSAAKKAGTSAPTMNANVKVNDVAPKKQKGGAKEAKKGATAEAEEKPPAGPGVLRMLLSVVMVVVATSGAVYNGSLSSLLGTSTSNEKVKK